MNINDLGLPQGLPELVEAWNRNSALNEYVLAQEPNGYMATALNRMYAPRPLPREMTAEDLGLDDEDGYWFQHTFADHLRLREKQTQPWPDAPYSFWLGADHG